MNNQTKLLAELNQARAAVLVALNAEDYERACCRGLMLDELCDRRTRLNERLKDIDQQIGVLAEKCALAACCTSGRPMQWLQRALQFLERPWISQILNRRLRHGEH
jgi:hypothetical protein